MKKTGEYIDKGDQVVVTPRAGLLTRQPSTCDGSSALIDIQRQMAVATVLFENVEDGGRSGAWHALHAVIEYFSSLGIPMAALQPLNSIAGALADAGQGISSPIFRPDKRKGRPPLPSMRTLFDQQIAAITDCCVQHFRKCGNKSYVDEGCREAARILNLAGLGRSFRAEEVKERRQRISALTAKDPRRAVFDDLRNSDAVRADPLRCAELMASSDFLNALPSGEEL